MPGRRRRRKAISATNSAANNPRPHATMAKLIFFAREAGGEEGSSCVIGLAHLFFGAIKTRRQSTVNDKRGVPDAHLFRQRSLPQRPERNDHGANGANLVARAWSRAARMVG